MGSNPILSANGTRINPVFMRAFIHILLLQKSTHHLYWGTSLDVNCEFVSQSYICGKYENTPQLHTEVYMRITKIEITNYKSIKEPVEINFYNGLPTVLIGKNGSGKTNIL